VAELVLQLGEAPRQPRLAVLEQQRHRLGPRDLADRRVHLLHRQVEVGLAQHLKHHVAAIVGPRHHFVRAPHRRGIADLGRPARR
jgi:hypothetical protein